MEISALLKDVRLQIAKGNFDSAKELLFGSDIDNNEVEANALKARILGFTDGIEKAQSMFFDLESVWPDNFALFKMHCEFLQEMGLYNEAVTLGGQILSKFKLHPEAYLLQIENYELIGLNSEAFKVCSIAMKSFPDTIEFHNKHQMLLPIVNGDFIVDESLEEVKQGLNVKSITTTDENIYEFMNLFKGRTGVFAVQTKMGKNWGYIPERREITPDDIRMHISGSKTLGIYVTEVNNTSSLMVLDLDIRKPFMKKYVQDPEERIRLNELVKTNGKRIVDLCIESGFSPLVESSGNKGLHIWLFSEEPIACRYWRSVGAWLLNKLGAVPEELSWEMFPKQDFVPEDGLGNLVKLPLGTHQKTGRQSLFVDSETFEPYEDQIAVIKNVVKLTKQAFESILGTITIDSFSKTVYTPSSSSKNLTIKESTNSNYNDVPENLKIDVKIPLPERNIMEVEQVLAGCKPMWLIMEKAKNEHTLEANEKHAFIYTFANIGEEGKVFIHQVMNQLDDYNPDVVNQMIKAVPPNPSGCNKIRKRIPHLCTSDCCNCQFRLPDGSYASPVVHAGVFPSMQNVTKSFVQKPASLSNSDSFGGESGNIDRLMTEYAKVNLEIEQLRSRASLLRRQINKIFNDSGKDTIETRIRVYHKLPEDNELLILSNDNQR